jgi:cellulose synthase/poly-beta-1,6-N-acetylglucosamine synthase-like glycosyltransferase
MSASFIDVLLAVVLGGWLLVSALSCFGVYRAQRDRDSFLPKSGEPAVVIIPVHGVPAYLAQMWRGISAQSYRPFRVIFAVESASDPAFAALRALEGGPPREIIVAGTTAKRAPKIHNVLAALRSLRADDKLIILADDDIVPSPDWLARLIKWQRKESKCEVVSGYRWMVPADDRWATAFVCVINSSAATAMRAWPFGVAWGGSMLMHRNAIAGLELERIWDRAMLDDLSLTRSVWAHAGRVHCPRDALVLTPASYGWKDAIAFARRQYLWVRIHTPWHWAFIVTVTTLPLVGWAVALTLALNGSVAAIVIIIAANALDHLRAFFRRQVPKKLWNLHVPGRVARLDSWGTPIWLLVNAAVVWSTLFGRRIDWAGRSYLLDSHGRVLRMETARASHLVETTP